MATQLDLQALKVVLGSSPVFDLLERGAPPEGVVGLRAHEDVRLSLPLVTAPKGGQFALNAKALHGNQYDGHTLGPVSTDLEKLTGVTVRRIHGDKGYRGHNYPDQFMVWITAQVRRVTKAIRRKMDRRAAIELVSATFKDDHRMGRNSTGRDGDRINAVLAAAGYNLSLLVRWFGERLRALLLILLHAPLAPRFISPRAVKLSSQPTNLTESESRG